jgi:biopolymer transport protein ExbB
MLTTCHRWVILAAFSGVLLAICPPSAKAQDGQPAGVAKVDAQESFLHWMARASGKLGIVLLLMSFYLVALISWSPRRRGWFAR